MRRSLTGGWAVSVMLPPELVWVLGAIGVQWPNIDEDKLRTAGSNFRQISDQLKDHRAGSMQQVEQMLHLNSSQSLELFQALWQKVSSGHMADLEQGLDVLADAMGVCADIVEGMKAAAIVQLGIFAAESAADVAAAIVTGGLAAGAEVALDIATREIVQGIFDQALQQIEYQVKQAMLAPVIDSLGSAGEDLAGQLLGNALGVDQGVDLGSVMSAASGGLGQGVSTGASDLTSLATDPIGPAGLGIESAPQSATPATPSDGHIQGALDTGSKS